MIWHSLSETNPRNRHTTFKAWDPALALKAGAEKTSMGFVFVKTYMDIFGRYCIVLRDPLPDERLERIKQ